MPQIVKRATVHFIARTAFRMQSFESARRREITLRTERDLVQYSVPMKVNFTVSARMS
jgi:hypothetical protein